MRLDLHIHTSASDGAVAPAEVVESALAGGLDVIAITDHDTVAGVLPAIEAVRGRSVEVIPGIEVSTSAEDTELHILGYFVDPRDPALLAHTSVASERREGRLREMVERLAHQGVEVPLERVLEFVGSADAPGRPHLARALVAEGIVDSVPQAFDRLIGNDHPAYVPTRLLEPAGAIRLIHEAGGIAVWAHPREDQLERWLTALMRDGLDGLEVFRPFLPHDRMERIRGAAVRHDLIVTGGSDWHGPETNPLGTFQVSDVEVEAFLLARPG